MTRRLGCRCGEGRTDLTDEEWDAFNAALADRFEAYEPIEADRGEPALLALRRAAYRRVLIERDLADAVQQARSHGVSWRQIGEAVGTTGEAARQRYTAA